MFRSHIVKQTFQIMDPHKEVSSGISLWLHYLPLLLEMRKVFILKGLEVGRKALCFREQMLTWSGP